MRIELDDISLSFQPGTPFAVKALDRVSLMVRPGERLSIAGSTGSGKSTLLGVMAGILRPAAGRVLHDGQALSRKPRLQPGRIGLGLQSPENCLFERTVFDDVAFAPRRMGLDGERLGQRVMWALECVGLDAAASATREPFSLSVGEQRRVALAGVIAAEPAVLLLDEPTAYLDPATRRDLLERLLAMNDERGTTMVVVGHDMDELAVFAERLVIMDDGRVAADGPADKLLKDEALLERYGLEAPGTVRLCRLLSGCAGREFAAVLDEEQAANLLQEIMGWGPGG